MLQSAQHAQGMKVQRDEARRSGGEVQRARNVARSTGANKQQRRRRRRLFI